MWGLILYVWVMLAIWQIVAGSIWLKKTNEKLVDGGWALGRLSVWLAVSLIVWFLGHLKIPVNTIWGIRGVMAVITGFGGWQIFSHRKEIRQLFWEKKWVILIEELLFAGGLVWLTWVRAHNPDVLDLEKFMDAGFIQGYLKSPTLPAMDMWLAGEKLNYYTFGHFMGAVMTQVWGIDMVYSYNLLLGLIMGLTLTLTFSVIINLISSGSDPFRQNGMEPRPKGLLSGSHPIIGGVIGTLVIGFGGNTHAIWSLIKNHTWQGYWYADATRFIYNTIHEFPAYSFVVSDLHGHVWDLPVVLMFLVCLIAWSKSLSYVWSGIMGGLLGVMVMTNTWDTLIYGMLVGLTGILVMFLPSSSVEEGPRSGGRVYTPSALRASPPTLGGEKFGRIIYSWAVMIIAMVLVALPWKLNFASIDQGVRLVTQRSPIWQLAVLWSGHLIITIIAVILSLKSNPKNRLVLAMAASAVILLIIPEIVFVKDIYPNHPRANTMFKLTYQAFVMMSILIGWVVGQIGINLGSDPSRQNGMRPRAKALLLGSHPFLLKSFLGVIVMVIIGSLLTFPYFAYRDYYGGLKTVRGLDGLAFMARDNLADYQAVLWIKQNVKDRPVILEAVGESYTQHGRFSVFTGLPTVLGWRVHEWLWRGGFEIPGKRTEEVKMMYEKPNSKEVKELFEKYRIKYVIVGNLERAEYKINEKEIKKMGEIVFKSGMTEIIKLP